MKLWEINDALEKLMAEHVDPETGELSAEAEPAIDALFGEREQKVLACTRFFMGLRAEADAVEGQEKAIAKQANRLAERKRILRNQADRLASYVLGQIGKDETFRDDTFLVDTVANPPRLYVPDDFDPNTLPDEYVKRTAEVKKGDVLAEMKKAEKEGKRPEWAPSALQIARSRRLRVR